VRIGTEILPPAPALPGIIENALFFLNLRHGLDDLPNDYEPQEFPSLEEAKAEAIASLREIAALANTEGRRMDYYDGIDIVSEDGRLLLTVTMLEALKLQA
jgi:hypothetical protein